ncbi:hypothetical protein GGX14DRAFT_643985 [Mycena pura]|uniref:ATPase inhibitor, mitochondrial n=1 Tax=Mycena pura TaxID=153505 RepID=A0AAD6YES0_9AGAR|nr:hypothetical protein GGX14DRAFT_643985 [Mycena pura]
MLARTFAVRRLPQLTAVRRLPQLAVSTVRFTSSFKEGSVAQSKGFKDKENAQEGEYARRRDAEKLQKLRAEIDRKKTELDQLEKEHLAELHKNGVD